MSFCSIGPNREQQGEKNAAGESVVVFRPQDRLNGYSFFYYYLAICIDSASMISK